MLAFLRRDQDETILCVANLSRSVQPVELDLSRFRGLMPVEMLGQTEFPRIGEQPYFLSLGAYGFYWFRLQHAAPAISERTTPDQGIARARPPGAVVGAVWDTLLDGTVRTLIERDVLGAVPAAAAVVPGPAAAVGALQGLGTAAARPRTALLRHRRVEFDESAAEGAGPARVLRSALAGVGRAREDDPGACPHAVLARITGAPKGHHLRRVARRPLRRALLERRRG